MNVIQLLITALFSINLACGCLGQTIDPTHQNASYSSEKSSPKKWKTTLYFPSGEISNISYYKNDEMIRYMDYLPMRKLFQDIRFKDGTYHGIYRIYSEQYNRLIKGKMKHGVPYSGYFEVWSEELQAYQLIQYKKDQIKLIRNEHSMK